MRILCGTAAVNECLSHGNSQPLSNREGGKKQEIDSPAHEPEDLPDVRVTEQRFIVRYGY